ncbi:hypothetical protein QTH91_02120 [Variovorax dokdonensis]|uniref:Sulfatase n=1 Tax=Variovorax dokdonensis TaxID=344883 RepID=A0ABT7N5Q3_9BURK|nr:hypothetical protein [Variovorax dokdonensis]MDM0043269.1 hypothetical protein [Variovorax dokdonensis]
MPAFASGRGWRLLAALLVLNGLLTMGNLWPTPWPRPLAQVSPELALALLVLCIVAFWRGRPGAAALRALAAVTLLWVLARYLDVTVQAVFGRPLNPYWDGRHAMSVLALAGWSSGAIAAAVLALLLAMAGLYAAILFCWQGVAAGLAEPRSRRVLAAASILLLVLAFAPGATRLEAFQAWRTEALARPVAPAIARQAQVLAAQLWPGATEPLSPSPDFAAHSLAGLRGADVLLVFLESYGACTVDDAAQRQALAPAREQLLQRLQSAGRGVVSTRVRSPTFGGSSWLAHAALLAGVDTRDPGDYERLLSSDRPSLVSMFHRQGWHTVGWMPGLQRAWPEGGFYGFDRIADAQGIGYEGLELGYWQIPDPASMALLHRQELAHRTASQAPRFIVFPTLGSHAPFRPLPPFDGDWARLATSQAYTPEDIATALAQPADWSQARPAYLESIGATLDWLGSYLAGPAPRELVTLVVGDHQPWAAVSGEGASWDVPVHVISSDAALLARFEALGFSRGLLPAADAGVAGKLGPRGASMPMAGLTAVLLAAFDDRPIASLPRP